MVGRIAVIVACVCGVTHAQGQTEPESVADAPPARAATTPEANGGAAPESLPRLDWSFDFGMAYHPETDIDNGGAFAVARGYGAAQAVVTLTSRVSVRLLAMYDFSRYDFSDTTRFGGSDPWNNVHTVRLGGVLNYGISERWAAFGGGFVSYAGEDGARFADSVTGGTLLGASYQWSERLTSQFGVTLSSELEDDVSVFPFLGINWRFADDWTLRSAALDAGSAGGGGLEVAWQALEETTISLGVVYLSRSFRLDDQGFAPGGVGRERRLPVFLRITQKLGAHTSVSLLGGVVLAGQLSADDAVGRELFEDDFDATPFVGVNVGLRF